jgi:hypothetical protein
VLIEPERQRIDLALELAEAAGEAIALFPERLGERHHRFDQAMLAVVVELDVVHAPALPAQNSRSSEQDGCRPAGDFATRTLASVHVADLTA